MTLFFGFVPKLRDERSLRASEGSVAISYRERDRHAIRARNDNVNTFIVFVLV